LFSGIGSGLQRRVLSNARRGRSARILRGTDIKKFLGRLLLVGFLWEQAFVAPPSGALGYSPLDFPSSVTFPNGQNAVRSADADVPFGYWRLRTFYIHNRVGSTSLVGSLRFDFPSKAAPIWWLSKYQSFPPTSAVWYRIDGGCLKTYRDTIPPPQSLVAEPDDTPVAERWMRTQLYKRTCDFQLSRGGRRLTVSLTQYDGGGPDSRYASMVFDRTA
jgi:hypothetical protein